MARYVTWIIACVVAAIAGCAATTTVQQRQSADTLQLTEISDGLPREHMWRQNVVLFDMNDDGYLDIICPPPRLSSADVKRPHIFLWDPAVKSWKEGSYRFPALQDYDYGTIAVGDLNGDGLVDLVLGAHDGRIIVLLNDGQGGFTEVLAPSAKGFKSRALALGDVNHDGLPDIVAVAEMIAGQKGYKPKGILVALNAGSAGWDARLLPESDGLFADSIALADFNDDGHLDIAIAPLAQRPERGNVLWLGDGAGNFSLHQVELPDRTVPFGVAFCRLSREGSPWLVQRISGMGKDGKMFFAASRWGGGKVAADPFNLEFDHTAWASACLDIDGDGSEDLVVFTEKGLRVFRHSTEKWFEIEIAADRPFDTGRSYGVAAGRNADGSVTIVYNLAEDEPQLGQGLRAYRIAPGRKLTERRK